MPRHAPRGLMILGTDTSVGKTWVTALAARELIQNGHRVGVYKPACSGSEPNEAGVRVWPDLVALARAIGQESTSESLLEQICPQRFHAPLAPPVAARLEGRTVDETLLAKGLEAWRSQVDVLLIEGVGGLLCPLTEEMTVADFAQRVGFPVLIVARLGLGTINHTLLTIEAAQHRGLDLRGVLFNESEPCDNPIAAATNPAEVARRTTVPILGVIRHGASRIIAAETGISETSSPTHPGSPGPPGSENATDSPEGSDRPIRGLHAANHGITIDWFRLTGENVSTGASDGL